MRYVTRACGVVLFVILLLGAGVAAFAATERGSYDRPPYYDGKPKMTFLPAAHLSVDFRTEPGSLDLTPDRSPALAGVLDSLRAEIDALGITRRLAVDVRLQGRPDVRFGCRRGGVDAQGVPLAPSEIRAEPPRRMSFLVEGPGKLWRQHVTTAAADSIRAIVSIQLGFDEYWVRQKDVRGGKTIDLGAGRSRLVPWLTSLDDPVQVLQLTGALVTPEGKVLRVGAEGILARRTGMAASVLGAQEVLTEEDLRALTTSPEGEVPAWRAALRALVAGLLQPASR